MNRWQWAQSSLVSGEHVLSTAEDIRLYDGSKKTDYNHGHLTLTNLRLLWKHADHNMSLVTELAFIVYMEMDSGGFLSSAKIVLHMEAGKDSGSYMKLSFKDNTITEFYAQLQKAFEQKAWRPSAVPTAVHTSCSKKVGILGIERALAEKKKEQDDNMSHAFEDLKNLMSLAKDMVELSKNVSSAIREKRGELSSDETVQLRSYLLGLGIKDPVTKEAIGSTTEYHKQLAQEICTSLEKSIEEAGGVMLLTEVYCRINRARGLELLSPDDVLNACQVMANMNLPLVLHKCKSGVYVLQLSSLNDESITLSIESLLSEHSSTGLSFAEFAKASRISLVLAQERLHAAELKGIALLDESSEGFRFYPNLLQA